MPRVPGGSAGSRPARFQVQDLGQGRVFVDGVVEVPDAPRTTGIGCSYQLPYSIEVVVNSEDGFLPHGVSPAFAGRGSATQPSSPPAVLNPPSLSGLT